MILVRGRFMRLFLLLGILSLLITSCAPGGSSSKLKVSVAAITGSAHFPGGLFFMGKNLDTGNSFIKRVEKSDDTLEVELPNGVYNFYVTGWDNDLAIGNYSGNTYCSQLRRIELSGEELPLNMTATINGCTDAVFNNGSEQGVLSLTPFSCSAPKGLKSRLDAGTSIPASLFSNLSDCSSIEFYEGGDSHYQVSIGEYDLGGIPIFNWVSGCFPINTAGPSIPFGKLNELKIPVQIKTFSAGSCTSSELTKRFNFVDGLHSPALNNKGIADLDTGKLLLDQDICNARHIASSPSFISSEGLYHLICSGAQLSSIISTNSLDHFELGKNINYNLASISGFLGTFDGHGHTITGSNNSLFSTINNTSGSRVEIENLNLRGFTIVGSGTSGVLINSVSLSNTEPSLYVNNINIEESVTISSSGATAYVGALIGSIEADAGVTSGEIKISNIHSKADVSNSASNNGTGGLIGRLDGTYTNVELSNISVGVHFYEDWSNDNQRVSISSKGKVGGVIGHLIGGENGSDIWVKVKNIASNSTLNVSGNSVGGIFGIVDNQISADKVYTNTIIDTSEVTSYIGGMVGLAGSGGPSYSKFQDIYAKTSLKSSYINSMFGGIVGAALNQTTSNYSLEIFNAQAELDIESDGNSFGGLVGRYDGPVGFTSADDYSLCTNCLVQGSLNIKSDGTGYADNDKRAGLVGQMSNGRIKMSGAYLDHLSGGVNVAGAYGVGIESYLDNSFIYVNNMEAYYNFDNGSTFDGAPKTGIIGGLVGYFETAEETENHFKSIDLQINMKSEASGCLFCGYLFGKGTIQGGNISNNFTNYSIKNSSLFVDGADLPFADEANFYGANHSIATVGTNHDNDGDLSCSLDTGTADDFFGVAEGCTLKFEYAWRSFSENAVGYLGGNFYEPFGIRDTTKFSTVQIHPRMQEFLYSKDYILLNDIPLNNDFGGFGNITYPFSGEIYSNGNYLYGVLGNPLVNYAQNASFGKEGEPLLVRGMQINCSGQNCGLIGETSGENNISVVATDLVISGDTYTGGLIGYAKGGFVDIFNSGIRNGTISSTSDYVGGFIGKAYETDSAEDNDLNISISNSFGVFSEIKSSSQYVGGFIGYMENADPEGYSSLDIENFYLVFSNTRGDLSLNDQGSNSQAGLIAGMVEGANNSTTIKAGYIELSQSQLTGSSASEVYKITAASTPLLSSYYILDSSSSFSDRIDYTGAGDIGYASFYPSELLDDMSNDISDDDFYDSGNKLKLLWEKNY